MTLKNINRVKQNIVRTRPSTKRINKTRRLLAVNQKQIRIKGKNYTQKITFFRGKKEIQIKLFEHNKEVHITSFLLHNYGNELIAEVSWPMTSEKKKNQGLFFNALKNSIPFLKKVGVKRITSHALRAPGVYRELGFTPGEIDLSGRWFHKLI